MDEKETESFEELTQIHSILCTIFGERILKLFGPFRLDRRLSEEELIGINSELCQYIEW